LLGWLRPAVDAVARIKSTVHKKLLFGFLVGALLLVGMGILSVLVMNRMDSRVVDLNRLEAKSSHAQEMLYAVTAQSHYRAMALLTGDDSYNTKIAEAKALFVDRLDAIERANPDETAFLERVRAANEDYAAASAKVLQLYLAGDIPAATQAHLDEEHPSSHVLEDAMRRLIVTSDQEKADARAAFRSDRALLTTLLASFSVASVVVALLLGFLLSWSFILPVRRMKLALAGIRSGQLRQRVDVPNRDEFGELARGLNDTSDQMANLFDDQRMLTDQLSETNASLAKASEAKSRFLANVSHELRTPMNAILGFTDALLAGVDGPLNAEQRASLEWVQRGGRDLLGLINEILDLSKIEAGRMSINAELFEPRELVESVLAQHRSLAAQKGIRLVWRDAGTLHEVRLDRQRVRQILVNLLGNALKFTPAGEVTIETGGRAEQALRVSVIDSGPGIDVADQGAIFDEFHHGKVSGSGTGLGLAISRRLARAMGGDITVDSELGRGSVFTVVLPGDFAVPRGAEIPVPRTTAKDAVLLSVDDDPSMAPLLHKMLAGHGYRVVAASGPQAAVEEARRLQPAAVLLDILMPERDGVQVLRDLKSDPATSAIPVIVVSVVDEAEVPEIADAHLSKPVESARLLEALAQRTPASR
jgi:signal transduction histidine kinase